MAHAYTVRMEPDKLHTIQNTEQLAVTPARTSLLAIAEAGYAAIRTEAVMHDTVSRDGDTLLVSNRRYDIADYEHIYAVCIGKCAVDAAVILEQVLGDALTDGLALDVRDSKETKVFRTFVGTHPYPSETNVAHTKEILALGERAGPRDLVLVVVSGGGSTLLCAPQTHKAQDEQDVVRHLFKKGATIHELNIVRKHLSHARGGGLAAALYPAEVVGLIFSDVPGDDLSTISSGPLVPDGSTLEDAQALAQKYGLADIGFPESHLFETPKDAMYFERVRNELVLTNTTALDAMLVRARELGYRAEIRETKLQGEARDVAKKIADELHNAPLRTVWLYGGETTVTITGPGKGGRNEEFALGALVHGHDDELYLSLASDGRDNTDFAGGIADQVTRTHAQDANLKPEDYLYTNDSYAFFHSLQQGVVTGYTGSNVADLVIAMKHGEA